MVQAKGTGYAMSTSEELDAIFRVSQTTGVPAQALFKVWQCHSSKGFQGCCARSDLSLLHRVQYVKSAMWPCDIRCWQARSLGKQAPG